MLAIPVAILALALPDSASEAAIAARVEIVRTAYGVPHVMAPDFESFGFAMGWLQSEDYGDVAARALVRGRPPTFFRCLKASRWAPRSMMVRSFRSTALKLSA